MDRILFKELDHVIVALFIGGVDHRHTGREEAHRQQRLVGLAVIFNDGALIGVLIVIVEVIHREAPLDIEITRLHALLDRRYRYTIDNGL